MDTSTIIENISSGLYDADLSKIRKAVEDRVVQSRKSITIDDYTVGDKVIFNNKTATRYMVGAKATVVEKRRTKLVVQLEHGIGRFQSRDGEPAKVTCPIQILDLV